MLDVDPVAAIDDAHLEIGRAHLRLLDAIPDVEASERWIDDGARNIAHWVAMRCGISAFRANRWVVAAYALQVLPRMRGALSGGVLSIDKVVELCRFATPETERSLVAWAERVAVGAVRHRADVEVGLRRADAAELLEQRSVRCSYQDDGRRFELFASLPGAEGRIVENALERLASEIPVMPGEDDPHFHDARLADALVAIASARIAEDPDPDRATIVVHASADGTFELDGGIPLNRTTVERLACFSRFETVLEDGASVRVRRSHPTRLAPAWMLRQVRYRDRECRFPGCGARRFTEAHHVRFWRDGGDTSLENLVLICSFHHRLVHEYGWRLEGSARHLRWHRPNGREFRPQAAGRLRA